MVVKLRQASAAPAEGNAVAAPPAEISPDARPAAAAIAADAAPAVADDEVPPGDDGSPPSIDKIPAYVVNMQKSHDFAQQFAAVRAVRKLLSNENNPPIQNVIDSGAVPHLVQLIKPGVARATIQFEATWALTNIVSGNSSHTQIVIDAGALPFFAQLLHSPNQQVREQAVWALGNTAGDSPAHRDAVIATGCAQRLADMATAEVALPVLRNVTWTMSNLCRGKPPVSFASISCLVKPLAKLLCSADPEIIADAAWALSYITENPDAADPIQVVITTAGVVGRLVELLSHRATNVQTVALRTVGNIVTGNDHQTQCMLDAGCLVPIGALMSNAKKSLRKEAAWTISNIAAGSASQIEHIVKANLVPLVLERMKLDSDDVQREACWVISNISSGGRSEHLRYLMEQNAVAGLCNLLVARDNRTVKVALEGIENLLRHGLREVKLMPDVPAPGQRKNACVLAVEACGGLDKIEALQHAADHSTYELAHRLLEEYFDAKPEEEGEGDRVG